MRILILLAGWAVAAAPVLIEGVPDVRQKADFCGEACVAMYLQKLGHDVDQDFVFDQSGLDATHARGCYSKKLKLALARIGFETGAGWATVRSANAKKELEAEFAAMLRDLQADVPSIVCMHYDDSPNTTEHFCLILGYDKATEELIYHEPAEDDAAYQRMPKARFLSLWPLKYKADAWTVIRFPLRAGQIRARPSKARYSDADFGQHLMQLKTRTPAGFTATLEKPFVVVGDIGAAAVQRRAEGTVRWVVEQVKHFYFEKDPNEIIDIWLFRDRASYEKHCWDLF
ncbi:MAG: hypothetical protein ACI8W8_000482 [Rhodothermales bacterium]|jgi:hypothetical protein